MTVLKKSYSLPDFCDSEILRYAGVKSSDISDELLSLLESSKRLASPLISPVLCFCQMPISTSENEVDFGFARVSSSQLCKNLRDCNEAIIFAATAGMGLDREIAKQSLLSPSLALMLDALGTERIEALCSLFNEEQKAERAKENKALAPRFSPGYGDLPLEFQKEIFKILDCQRQIGLFLGEGLLMIPSKSVTAIIGIKENK